MSDDKIINLGPGAEITFLSIDDDPEDPMNPGLEKAMSGSVARRNISLQVQNPDSKLWQSTDRIFKGEVHRFVLSTPEPLNATPQQIRAWYESEKGDYPFPPSSFLRTRNDRRSDPYILAVWFFAIILIVFFLCFLSTCWG